MRHALVVLCLLALPAPVGAQRCHPLEPCADAGRGEEAERPEEPERRHSMFSLRAGVQVDMYDLSVVDFESESGAISRAEPGTQAGSLSGGPSFAFGYHPFAGWRAIELHFSFFNLGGLWADAIAVDDDHVPHTDGFLALMQMALATGPQVQLEGVTLFASAVAAFDVWMADPGEGIAGQLGGEVGIAFHVGECEIVELSYRASAMVGAGGVAALPSQGIAVKWGHVSWHPDPDTCTSW